MDMENLRTHPRTYVVCPKAACLLLLAWLLLLGGCKKDARVKLPEVAPRLVVHAYISPQDSLIQVRLNRSSPLYDKQQVNIEQAVADAAVTISSSSGTYTLPYHPGYSCYQLDSTAIKIRSGITYYLSVATPDGKQVTAFTKVPEPNTSLNISVESDSKANNAYVVKSTWSDPPSETNYYRIIKQHTYRAFNPAIAGDTISHSFASGYLLKDTDGNNGTITRHNNFSLTPDTDQNHIYMHLLHVSEEYFRYTEKVVLNANSGDPFAEAVQMYSNVNGGYGVFAGYSRYTMKVSY